MMTNWLKRSILLPSVFYKLWNSGRKQRKFVRTSIVTELQIIRNTHDSSLNDNDFRKITEYYALLVPVVCGTAFSVLRGAPLHKDEQVALTYLGALTGLFDDFFDKKQLSNEEIQELINNPFSAVPRMDSEKLFLQFYIKALSHIPDVSRLKELFFEVYMAQIKSKKQFDQDIDATETLDITLSKGGESLLFYRAAISDFNTMSDTERELLYTLGGLIQLGNDIFDVYKDTQSGIRTLVNSTTNIANIRSLLKKLTAKLRDLAYHINYPKRNVENFNQIISLVITSRCFVCLDQLEELEKLTNKLFKPVSYSRKQLICDMQKPGNILKMVRYYLIRRV